MRAAIRRFSVAALAMAAVIVLTSTTTSLASVSSARPRIVAERVIGGLRQAVAFTFDDRGRIWFVEKEVGDVRIFDPATGLTWRFAVIPDVRSQVEQGLVGITLHPDFPTAPYVYLYATRELHSGLRDQILRMTAEGDRGTDVRVIFDSAADPGGQHSGGRLLFGPDGMLYATVGDAQRPETAQDVASERGKILRFMPDGGIPSDNPFPGSPVWAYGIRNSFGLAFDPETGSLWETENGPACDDEVNRIVVGGNYGWGPGASCEGGQGTSGGGPHPILPLSSYSPTIAPTGIAFCEGCGLGLALQGRAFFGTYNAGELRMVKLDRSRTGILREEQVAQFPPMVLSVEAGPDGGLYFSSYIAIFRLSLAAGRSPAVAWVAGEARPRT